MRKSWASVTVGLLILIVGIISYKLIHSTSKRSSDEGYMVWGLFRDASGVFEKSRVQTAGISIGQIESRSLDTSSGKAKITIRIKSGITLYDNAVVEKKSASLLGEYYLEIDPGTAVSVDVRGVRHEHHVLKDGDRIMDVREPTAIGDIITEVGTLMPIMRDILDDVRKLTSGRLNDIAENVNELIETNSEVLERLLNRVDHIAASVEGVTTAEAGDVKESLKNVREITESIKDLIGTTKGSVADTTGAVHSSLDRLQATIDNLDRTMQNVEKVSERVENGQGTVGHLVNDDTIARNVEDITSDANTFVHGLTSLQTIVGLRTEYNFLSSTFKNYLSITLMPRPDKYYLIELVDDPRGYQTVQTQAISSSLTGQQSVTTVTTTDQLRFSLMLGKRVGPVGGRFGIKESTGGVGGDLFLLDDRLTLSIDVFDMRVNQYPRVKPYLSGAIWKRNLFLVLGADDVLNFRRARGGAGGGFDYFTGVQLTFNDEDLKSLLLFGGAALAGAAGKQ